MLDTESYENVKKALGLLKLLAQGERNLADRKVLAQEDFLRPWIVTFTATATAFVNAGSFSGIAVPQLLFG